MGFVHKKAYHYAEIPNRTPGSGVFVAWLGKQNRNWARRLNLTQEEGEERGLECNCGIASEEDLKQK